MDGKDFLITGSGVKHWALKRLKGRQTNVCEVHGSFLDCAVVLQLFGFGKEYRPS